MFTLFLYFLTGRFGSRQNCRLGLRLASLPVWCGQDTHSGANLGGIGDFCATFGTIHVVSPHIFSEDFSLAGIRDSQGTPT